MGSKIVFLGTGPTKPVRRRDEVRTNSSVLFIKNNIKLLIDCTPNFLEQVRKNKIKDIDFGLITHAHKDAIDGLRDLDKWVKHKIPIFSPPRVLEHKRLKKKFKNIILKPIMPHKAIKISDFSITPFRIIHAEVFWKGKESQFPCYGYLIDNVLYAEDMEGVPANSEKYFTKADILIVDAAMWFGRQIRGHLNTEQALQLIKKYDPDVGILIQAGHTYPSQKEAEKEIKRRAKELDIQSQIVLARDKLSLEVLEEKTQELYKQAFGSPGGKTNLVKKLLKYMPEHKNYVEAFAGGAALFWAKKPAEVNVLNDLDSEIAFAYRFIQNITEDQLNRLKQLDWKPSKYKFFKLRDSTPPKDPILRFYRFFYLYGYSYGGTTDEKATYGYLDKMRHAGIFDDIMDHKEQLKDVKIFNKDYKEVIKEFDNNDTFFYLDPPYPKEWPGKGKVNYFTKEDCKELHDLLKQIKGKFLLSINNLDWIRKMFSDFNINKLKNRRTFRHNDVPKYELVIYNYSTKSLSELSGIYLVPSHAMMIWIGEKDLIVKSRKFPEMVNKDLYLIGDEWCFGIINLKEPKEISLDEFRKLEDKHRIREDERHRWWPDKDILYAYEFDIIKLFEEPKRVKVPQGVQTFIKDVEFLQETGAADVTGAPIAATGLHPIVIWGKRKKKRKIKYGEEVFDLTDEEIENLYIRKKGGKWCVVHSDGRLIKCFPTKEEADRMHKAIIISKIKRGKMEENTHSDCINFINGWCKLKKKPVESDKPACPDFQPKKEMIRDTLLELVDNIELLSDKDLIDLHKKIHIMYENGN